MQPDRRKLIKALSLGGGTVAATTLPAAWTPPVVDTVLLPAHAQTTGGVLSGSLALGFTDYPRDRHWTRGLAERSVERPSLVERLITAAHANAGNPPPGFSIFGYAERYTAKGEGLWRLQVLWVTAFYQSLGQRVPGADSSPIGNFVPAAHAQGAELGCTFKVLWQTAVRLSLESAPGVWQSGWQNGVTPTEQCGFLELVEPPITDPSIDIRLSNANDLNNASIATIVVREGPHITEIPVRTGGTPLTANCLPEPCLGA